MWLFKRKSNPFTESAKVLAEKGFGDEYISAIKQDIEKLKKTSDINKGKSYLCSALLICGKLSDALNVFAEIDIDKLDKILSPHLVQNMIFCYFVQDNFSKAEELYEKHNRLVLHDHTDSMRRTLAVHEHIKGRYENTVTIIAKLLDSDCRFLDICLIKAMLKLDMFESASEIASSLNQYDGLEELGKEVSKLKGKLYNGLKGKRKT